MTIRWSNHNFAENYTIMKIESNYSSPEVKTIKLQFEGILCESVGENEGSEWDQ